MAKAERHSQMVELVVGGYSYEAVAGHFGMTANAARLIVNRRIAANRLDEPDIHLKKQVARLHRALRTIDSRLDHNDLNAVDKMLKVIVQLDRYHVLAAPPAQSPAPALAPPAPRLALTHAPAASLELGPPVKNSRLSP